MMGRTLSPTATTLLQELEQLLFVTLSTKVKLAPHVAPATTVTIWALVAPEMEPLPLMDQE